MTDKVINLFDQHANPQDTEYTKYLGALIKQFEKEFPIHFSFDQKIYFAQNVWNFANLSLIMPADEYEKISSNIEMGGGEKDLLIRMIKWKGEKFGKHKLYIEDFEFWDEEGTPKFEVTVVDEEEYLMQMASFGEDDFFDDDLDPFDLDRYDREGFIDRTAIMIEAKKPFHDWAKKVLPELYVEEDEGIKIYLVNELLRELNGWMEKNFDKFFQLQLDGVIVEEELWPKNRTYELFKLWFDCQISTEIYDTQDFPISKSD